MSWFGWGKKKETPEEKYKVKLDQLEKLGFSDRKKNLTKLQQYAGNVNLVIQDYKATAAPKQQPKPKEVPKPKVQAQPPPKSVAKPDPKPVSKPKPAPVVEPKVVPKAAPKTESKPITKTESKPPSKSKSEQKQPVQSPTDDSKESVKPKAVVSDPKPTVKAVQPIMPDMGAPSSTSKPAVVPKMLFNLRDLPSADVRQLLLNIGEPVIAEIVFSNAINGEQFYHYIVVNPLLKKFNVSFAKEVDYSHMVNQCEISYKVQ